MTATVLIARGWLLQLKVCCEPEPCCPAQLMQSKAQAPRANVVGSCSPSLRDGGWQHRSNPGCCLGWETLWAGDRQGHPDSAKQDTRRCMGFIPTHLLFRTCLGFLLQFCRLCLLLSLPHKLLDEPPRDDRQQQGGCGRGRPPVLVPDLFGGAEAGLRVMARGQEPW